MGLSGEMSREDLVSLLIELVTYCETLQQAPMVSLNRDLATGNWGLTAKWVVKGDEKESLNRIARTHGYTVSEADGYTIIQKPQL
jgi:hypothetical protein